jgi:hypothetical protein
MRYPIVYSDESGLGERYLVFGAIYVPAEHQADVERELDDFCRRRGFGDRELSWKKCSRRESERYAEFADLFWALAGRYGIEFRAMVVDTHQHPLKHEESGATTEELGFYRYYHLFLTRSTALVAREAENVVLHVADVDDQYQHRTEVLVKTITGKMKELLPGSFAVADLDRPSPKESRIHQLADVLTGAVSYRLNGRSSHKEEICQRIETRLGQRLDEDVLPNAHPFNVWGFAPKGGARWTKGSRGRV